MDLTMHSTESSPYRPDLSIGHLFSRAWGLFKENMLVVVASFSIYVLLTGFLSGSDFFGALNALTSMVALVIAGPLAVGLAGVMLRVLRHEPVEIVNLFDGFKKFGQAFGVYILMSVAVGVGLILLIVPGIIVAVGLWPALPLVYDEDLGVVETLQRAWDMTRGYKMQLFVLGFVLLLLTLVGLVALFVGVFFTGALATLIGIAAYEELSLGQA